MTRTFTEVMAILEWAKASHAQSVQLGDIAIVFGAPPPAPGLRDKIEAVMATDNRVDPRAYFDKELFGESLEKK